MQNAIRPFEYTFYAACISTGTNRTINFYTFLMIYFIRWLYNACSNHKLQLKLCQSVTQKFLDRNTTRAAENAAPLTYEECLSMIRLECQSEGVSDTLLALGSCYSGQKVNDVFILIFHGFDLSFPLYILLGLCGNLSFI